MFKLKGKTDVFVTPFCTSIWLLLCHSLVRSYRYGGKRKKRRFEEGDLHLKGKRDVFSIDHQPTLLSIAFCLFQTPNSHSKLSLTRPAEKIKRMAGLVKVFCLPLPSFHKTDGCGDLWVKTVNRPGFSQVIS